MPTGIDRCPTCGAKTKVIDSRPGTNTWRRRRACLADESHRYTTYELRVDFDQLDIRASSDVMAKLEAAINAALRATLFSFLAVEDRRVMEQSRLAMEQSITNPLGEPPRPRRFHVYAYEYRCDACQALVVQTRPAIHKTRAVQHAGCVQMGQLRYVQP